MREGALITPATEWFLDNFHLISSELVEIREHLPRRYYRELPALAVRQEAGEARIYAMAVALLRHTDSRLDLPQLTLFLNSYQHVAPLTLGELWAWPSMLKLALVENLRRLGDEIMVSRSARRVADADVARIDAGPIEPEIVIPEDAHDAYLMQMLHRAREYDVRRSPLRAALESHLASRGLMAEDIVRAEQQRQAASQASVANAITSLRLCTTIDWREYVEAVSLVENVLRRDPSGTYARMDFLSRDRQRRAVEELAEPIAEAQVRVALKAVEMARQAHAQSRTRVAAHVGYHLIGRGRAGLELDLGYRPKWKPRLRRLVKAHATLVYLGAILLSFAPLLAAALGYAWFSGASTAMLVVAALLCAIPASELAMAFVQKLASRLVQPEPLPRLELTAVPEESRAIVVIPTLLTSVDGVESLLEHLEVIAIANRDPRIHFAILSDHLDAPTRETEDDAPILDAARSGIEALNARAGGDPGPKFYLFHRDRQWNEREQVWMGWERKRGKLEEFNRLVRGATDTTFTTQVGPLDALAGIKYCITHGTEYVMPAVEPSGRLRSG